MWPEILPSFVIIVGSLYLTSFLIGQIDKYEYGGKVGLHWCCSLTINNYNHTRTLHYKVK